MATKAKDTSNTLKVAVPLLRRTATFLVAFILLSGILGPKIIGHGLVNKDGFQVYGGAGKALLFGVVALGLLVWRAGITDHLPKWKAYNLGWFILSAASTIGAWFGIDKLLGHWSGLTWPILTNLFLLLGVGFAAIGSFGLTTLHKLYRTYKKQIVVVLVLSIAFYVFLYVVYGLWTVLATVVLHSVKWLLTLVGLHSSLIPPRTIVFSKFGINVAEYCSGIESIALFAGLYVLIGILDWSRFNHNRYLGIFLPALLILFIFNILRVAVLILGGYYINPQIAFSLFHTYAGMIFFIVYSILFWAVSYKWMIKQPREMRGL